MTDFPADVAGTQRLLRDSGYVPDLAIATAVFLAATLERPLLLEGEPGTGKTELAKVLARSLERPLIRLQCYEGLDASAAVYEWNYARQLLHIRAAEATGVRDARELERDVYTREYLLSRPLLEALEAGRDGPAPVLLIDELDRADEPFEAFLLELLGEYQITIPELGTVRAVKPPLTIITSNRTREVHDAVRRRCFYHWVDYPSLARELEILRLSVPGADDALAQSIVAFVREIRTMDLYKNPGIAETINWAQALSALNCVALDPATVDSTLGTLLKYQDDIARIEGSEAARILAKVSAEAAGLHTPGAEGGNE